MEWSRVIAAQMLGPEIAERRSRLIEETRQPSPPPGIQALISEFDAALAKIDAGTYGRCETCGDLIEQERLQTDPLTRFCIDHLNDAELRAHERDLELATQIQEKLLPPRHIRTGSCEAAYVYHAAGPVGGDYCELLPSADRRSLFFAIGDVSGKGVAASLLMTHLSAILRSLLSLDLQIPDIVSRANRLLCENTLSSHYATLLCGRVGPEGLGELAQAGHCRPLLVGHRSSSFIEASGLPLGLFNRATYPVMPFQLEAGESLLLYTDGLTEARNSSGEEFGESRLLELRPAAAVDLLNAVTSEVGRFRSNAQAHDDLTVVALRRLA